MHDLKNPNGSKGNHKSFDVLDPCKEMIKSLKQSEVRERMLKLGHDENLLLPLNPKSLGKEFREACKILGIDDLRFHDLRHEGCDPNLILDSEILRVEDSEKDVREIAIITKK